MKIFGITGWKNSGKTTLVVKLVEHFSKLGMKVATVKHAHHDFDTDVPDTDSYRHRKAGAKEVAVVSSQRWAIFHEMYGDSEPSLEEILGKLSEVDLVIVEGYKIQGHPKIQVIRTAVENSNQPMPENIPGIVAFASDASIVATDYGRDCDVLDMNDTPEIADFIARHLDLDVPR